MLVYITFRFELTSGLAAICCLVHDLLVMLSVYVLLQIPLDSNFIAAALTILGYSINASIIVFDRVRENLRTARAKEPFEVIGEKSILADHGPYHQHHAYPLFTIGMVYILGVPSLKQFTLPLIVGILAGGWSSVMLSTGLWGFRKVPPPPQDLTTIESTRSGAFFASVYRRRERGTRTPPAAVQSAPVSQCRERSRPEGRAGKRCRFITIKKLT